MISPFMSCHVAKLWQNCRKVCDTRITLLSSSQLFLSWFSFFFFFFFFFFPSLFFFFTILSCSSFFTSSSLHIFFSQPVVLSFQLSLVWVVMFKICQFYFMGLPKSIFYGFLCFNICGFFFFLVDLVFLWWFQATHLYFFGIFWVGLNKWKIFFYFFYFF